MEGVMEFTSDLVDCVNNDTKDSIADALGSSSSPMETSITIEEKEEVTAANPRGNPERTKRNRTTQQRVRRDYWNFGFQFPKFWIWEISPSGSGIMQRGRNARRGRSQALQAALEGLCCRRSAYQPGTDAPPPSRMRSSADPM